LKEPLDEKLTDVEAEVLQDTPWFLEVDPPRHVASDHKHELPKVPADAPAMLEPMLKYVYEDMGLDDLAMLDLRELDPPAALGANLIMIFGTARSERHLHVSSGRFVRWLKRHHKVSAKADGLIGPGELKTKLRRLRKKAKLMGTNTAIIPGGDNGISTGWICVNFPSSAGDAGEAESFDDSGRFSGFGAAPTGTTIVVQCMTEARRAELDLETLWQGVLKRSLERERKVNSEAMATREELDAMVSKRVQLPLSANQWQAMKSAADKHRYFSTMARRLRPDANPSTTMNAPSRDRPPVSDVETLRRELQRIQVAGLPIEEKMLPNLISAIFQAEPLSEDSASQRLALLDELLLTAKERGLNVYSRDVLVALIESIVACQDYGPELQRAQKNLEYILRELNEPLETLQVMKLMTAYVQRADWDSFWDAFRTPTRFGQRRAPDLYALAYSALASSGDRERCIKDLRWVYPEMIQEDPPVMPVGYVYDPLKACIDFADPGAEAAMNSGPPQGMLELRRWERQEFRKMLQEVEELRRQARGFEARKAMESSV
jgi:hypothetical protein